jgi:hypothetical protein
MKRYKLPAPIALLVIVVMSAYGWYWHRHSGFSAYIRWKGTKACANRQPCVFSLADIFPGDWDRLFIFDMSASQDEINHTLGQRVAKPDLQRLVVFMQGSKVTRIITESEGVEHPEGHEAIFDHIASEQNHWLIYRNWNFVMAEGAESCESCITLMYLRPGELPPI